ncbi:response regulator [Desulfuromonas thiophila]|uniref:histidine kinase n=1 Tax=Desulfuromonas thiophila TaxID=57664 RepID=A0A1G7AH06_9BACT|nr:response regulator [Desulfuromonas thiophila]SDE13166.1 signal transduction histidine kinase [Desulfuromonas thiophila]
MAHINPFKTIQFRLPALILLIGLVPLALFGFFSLLASYHELLRVQIRAGQRTAVMAVQQIEQTLQDSARNLTTTAENLSLSSLPPEEQEWTLLMMLKQQPELKGLRILDPSGTTRIKIDNDRVHASGALADQSVRPDMAALRQGKTVFSAPNFSEGLGYLLTIDIPLVDPVNRTLSAVLRAKLAAAPLFSAITDIRIGEQGGLYVLDGENRLLAHSDPSLVFRETRFTPGFMAITQDGSTDEHVRYASLKGIEVFGAGARGPLTGWWVVAERPAAETLAEIHRTRALLLWMLAGMGALCLPLTLFFSARITRPLKRLEQAARAISDGHFNQQISVAGNNELARVAQAFNQMCRDLLHYATQQQHTSWLKDGLGLLEQQTRSILDLNQLGHRALQVMAQHSGIAAARLLIPLANQGWQQVGSYCVEVDSAESVDRRQGLALVQQCAQDRTVVTLENIARDQLVVATGFAGIHPGHLLAMPLLFEDELVAVLELASLPPFSEAQRQFFDHIAPALAVILHSSQSRKRLEQALKQSQELSAQLQAQQEELRVANEELEEQTQQLRASEEQLRVQQEELQSANEELEEKTETLAAQQKLQMEKNRALQAAQESLQEKAAELEKASRYKSEFLANMSHELRTPLNSLLILAHELAGNKSGHLDDKETEAAQIIYSSGSDLLQLINEILDLSKIEAGRLELHRQPVFLDLLSRRLEAAFRHMADSKNLSFSLERSEGTAELVVTDPQRLEQILKNLLSNALKFTDRGGVSVRFYQPDSDEAARQQLGDKPLLAIAVRDTGIGIAKDHLEDIFGAFQQVDGTISRRYGGTGLGLSITRELSKLLGARVTVDSEPGKGSTFTLYLPLGQEAPAAASQETVPAAPAQAQGVSPRPEEPSAPADPAQRPKSLEDDREQLSPHDHVILIVEDDLRFARILADLCHERHFRFLHSADGESALELLQQTPAICAILLDMRLPGLHGMELLEIVKNDRNLRHIPVHVITATEDSNEALQRGALSLVRKPVQAKELEGVFKQIESMSRQSIRQLLIVEGESGEADEIRRIIGNGNVHSTAVNSGESALTTLQEKNIDCMVLDLNLPDMSAIDLLQQIDALDNLAVPPVIIYSGRRLSEKEEQQLSHYTRSIIIRDGNRSPDRLLDEASLFLHRMVSELPDQKQKIIDSLHRNENIFDSKTVLLVDDDMRNIFALSHVLEQRGLTVLQAANGQKALEVLDEHPEINLVLMDIMMPIMDGYEATRRIRARENGGNLPILALTAKAMPEDRQRCLDAGANDYLTKPVHVERLLSLLRIWLYR